MQGHSGFCRASTVFKLLPSRPAQRLQHIVDTPGVPKPVENEGLWTASILAIFFNCFSLSVSMGPRQTQHTPTVGGRKTL